MKNIFRLSQQQRPAANISKRHTVANSVVQIGLQPKLSASIPPVAHPTPYQRLSILATEEGLLISSYKYDSSKPQPYIRITYGWQIDIEESTIQSDRIRWEEAAVVFGILGSLTLDSGAYVLVITGAAEAGDYLDAHNVVHEIKSVAAIPLHRGRAQTSINFIKSKYKLDAPLVSLQESVSEEGLNVHRKGASHDHEFAIEPGTSVDNDDTKPFDSGRTVSSRPSSPTSSTSSSSSSVVLSSPAPVRDQIRPEANRFLTSPLSFWNQLAYRQSTQSSTPEVSLAQAVQEKLGPSATTSSEVLHELSREGSPVPQTEPQTENERQDEMDKKIMRTVIKEFTKGGMYFAYNFDLTTSLQHKQREIARLRRKVKAQQNPPQSESSDTDTIDATAEPNPSLPIWRRVTKQFWWNEYMLNPFIEAGVDRYILPVMQGFFQNATFRVPEEAGNAGKGVGVVVKYTLVSRRSRDRAGLRYQRRGVDDDANVANFVETEAIAHLTRDKISHVLSHTQIRGSVPLFWTQEGYGLKPPLVLDPERTHQQNSDALRKHFARLIARYGSQTIVNLAEQHGKEAVVTDAYRQLVNELNPKDVRYFEYDFHRETRGMKYENISNLISKLSKIIDMQRFLWICDGVLMSEQKETFRVNCIDCLDRTNVVQSAFARQVLNRQLEVLGLHVHGTSGRTEEDIVFNDVWANNGDAISREYAGTSALKGDYTRTGRRDVAGLFHDGVNSLARLYSSTFSDWFSQAVIDFMLGNRTYSVFSEFLLTLRSTDPRERVRTDKLRAEATATSVSRVLAEGETLLSGWTLLSPSELNTRISDNFEEKIVLLSVKAVYVVSYDYALEKVARYTRIPLNQITKITKGTYILSPLEEGSRDVLQNYGFMIHYPKAGETTRISSYSLRNSLDGLEGQQIDALSTSEKSTVDTKPPLSQLLIQAASGSEDGISFAAFKALPVDPARIRRPSGSFMETANNLAWAKTCKEAVDAIVDAIYEPIKDAESGKEGLVVESEIVSLEEAQRQTTVMSKMEYGIKRLIWLGR